jgi:hypothetical protein
MVDMTWGNGLQWEIRMEHLQMDKMDGTLWTFNSLKLKSLSELWFNLSIGIFCGVGVMTKRWWMFYLKLWPP